MRTRIIHKPMMAFALGWTLLLGVLILSPERTLEPLQVFKFFEGTDKVVHFTLFLGFTSLWITAFRANRSITLFIIFLSLFLSGFSEYLQSFVEGRDPEVRDALIDSVGALVGTWLALSYNRKYRIRRK